MRARVVALFFFAAIAGCRRVAPPPDVVVVACPSGPASLVPDVANEEFTISVLSNVYETLVDFDARLAVRPGLAESWYTEDDLTWVFRLRKGAVFHDGSAVDAHHVVAALERARSDPASRRRAELTSIASMAAVDAGTLVVRTSYPFGALPHRLANVAIWKPGVDAQSPVGSGPYRVRSWSAGREVALEAVDTAPGGPPVVRALTFRVLPEVSQRLRQLREGKVHLVLDVPADELQALDREPHLRTVTEKGLRVLFLALDVAREVAGDGRPNPFRHADVRRAVALAVDRDRLVHGALSGHGEIVDQVVAPAVFGYRRDLPRRPFDRTEARRLLAAAGFATGFQVELDYMPRKYQAMPAVVASLVKDLGDVGIGVRPREWETAPFLARVESRESGFYLWGWMSTGGDAVVSYDYLLHTPARGYGLHNGGGYSSPETDRLLEQAARLLSTDRRAELLHRVAAQVQADVPVIPLYRQTDLYGLDERLDFEPRVDRRIRGRNMRWHPKAH